MNEQRRNRKTHWNVLLVILLVIAVGIAVIGLILPPKPPEYHLTPAPSVTQESAMVEGDMPLTDR